MRQEKNIGDHASSDYGSYLENLVRISRGYESKGEAKSEKERLEKQMAPQPSVNRVEKMINFLKKVHINRPDEMVIRRISQSEKLLDLGVINTEYAFNTYQNVKDMAGTETKTYIGQVLGLDVSGPPFEDFPFIFSAMDEKSDEMKLIKILRVAEGCSDFEIRNNDVQNEIQASNFHHEAIVPMQHAHIEVDVNTARIANCRVGVNDVLIMPWYITTLNKCASSKFTWIAREGIRVINALEYLHSQGVVHLDIKSMNIFISVNRQWFLGDFGSCKRIGEIVTSSTWQYCYENILSKPAIVKYDWYMFLVMILIETLPNRHSYSTLFFISKESNCTDYNKVIEYATGLISDPEIGPMIESLLQKIN